MDSLATLPPPSSGKLPQSYESAKVALAECERIDECKEWADKAAALASYAKQAEDQTLMNHAMRIQGRASRRIGELLKQYDGRGRPENKADAPPNYSQRDAAKEAGLSHDQQKSAVRIANIPRETFERAVESDTPPTKTALADMGRKPRPKPEPLVDLEGRSEADYRAATQGQGELREFAKFAATANVAAIIRGSKPHEIAAMRQNILTARNWLNQISDALTKG